MEYIDSNSLRIICRDNNFKYCKSNSNKYILDEFNKILEELSSHLIEGTVEKTANWMLYKNLWLKNENKDLNSGFYKYVRGDIILSIDFGTINIGTEIRYPHPCVVLYDNNEDWLIVAPITASQLDKNKNPIVHEPFEILANAQKSKPKNPKEFQFTKDSVIQVDQIQRISKYRAINKKPLKLRVDLLNQIDNVLLENFTPLKYKLLENMKEINSELVNSIKDKDEEILRLKEQNTQLKNENEEYEGILNKIKVTSE